jgi:hypothetical protein
MLPKMNIGFNHARSHAGVNRREPYADSIVLGLGFVTVEFAATLYVPKIDLQQTGAQGDYRTRSRRWVS